MGYSILLVSIHPDVDHIQQKRLYRLFTSLRPTLMIEHALAEKKNGEFINVRFLKTG